MKKLQMLASAGLTLVTIGTLTAPVYAWHPKGTIIKEVQNQTVGGTISDANDITAAISTAPGDTLLYTITVKNAGAPAANGDDDMASTVLTDTLPTGIELVSNPAQRTITENLGTIKPGDSVTKTYAVKVTSTTDGDTITNQACFTGNSIVNDNPQHGCDVAIITVKVPPVPQPPVTPQPPVLPNTGSTSLAAGLVVLIGVIAGSAVNVVRLRRRGNQA